MSLGALDRLRIVAENLPLNGSVILTRESLLEVISDGSGRLKGQGSSSADYTVKELAAMFGRAPSTIRSWLEVGRISGAYRLNGREWRIPQASLDGFLREVRCQGGGAVDRKHRVQTRLSDWRREPELRGPRSKSEEVCRR